MIYHTFDLFCAAVGNMNAEWSTILMADRSLNINRYAKGFTHAILCWRSVISHDRCYWHMML